VYEASLGVVSFRAGGFSQLGYYRWRSMVEDSLRGEP